RGDIASSVAVQQLRRLDDEPPGPVEADELLGRVGGALHRAHDRIGEVVDEDPALNGTSTTATVLHFDGRQVGVGHVGDSRAYLLREGEISRLTSDHTFVQSLVDEGRITEAESRVHPHRNVILKAVDGIHEAEPDLFVVALQSGDRLLVCSDGATASLDDDDLLAILGDGTPDFAAVELVRRALDAGSTDNVTCLVADVLDEAAAAARSEELADLQPMVVGAATDVRRRPHRHALGGGLFRGRTDTGEIPAVDADLPPDLPADVHAISSDPVDPEAVRYAPRPPRRFAWARRALLALVLVGLGWMGVAAAYTWSQQQYYVGEVDGQVQIFRGVDLSLPGVELSEPYESTNVTLDRLPEFVADGVREGVAADDLEDARTIVENLAGQMSAEPAEASGDIGSSDTGSSGSARPEAG
ncbi:MAG: PP2C family protein-serine/threonine phosphatase, partial [Nocardioides sp.]